MGYSLGVGKRQGQLPLPVIRFFQIAFVLPIVAHLIFTSDSAKARPGAPRQPAGGYIGLSYVIPSGNTINLTTGDDLQQALNAAQPGDEVVLAAGVTYTGNFVLPVKSGAAFITVRSSRCAELPYGARVTPAQSPSMARLATPNVSPVLRAPVGSHHWRFQCLEFTQGPTVGTWGYDLIQLGDGDSAGSQRSLDAVPHHLEFDRVIVRARDDRTSVQRGFSLNSAWTSVTNSHVSGIKGAGVETQAVCGWNGPGPFTIINNYLEASGVNVMFGGAATAIPGLIPSDITVRRNHFFKPLSWRGVWSVKNLFELKNARRITVDGNTFENNWGDAQTGESILLTVRNQDGTNPWAEVSDVRFTNNLVKNVGGGVFILGQDYNHPSLKTRNVLVANNLFFIDGPTLSGRGQFLMMTGGAENVTADHNTVIHTGQVAILGPAPHTGVRFTNNVAAHNEYGVYGDGVGSGMSAINTYWPGGTFAGNLIAGADPLRYPAGNSYPAGPLSELLTASYALRTLVLGADGRTTGVDFAALQAAQSGGDATPPPTSPPPPVPSPTPTPNPTSVTESFVRQHYADFLNREPDVSGMAFWVGEFIKCGDDAPCREVKRVHVSAAFFLSIEFQETGFYLLRAQRAAFGRRSADASRLSLASFLPEARALGSGVVVGQGDWRWRLEQNKQAYAERVVSGAEFAARFPETQTAAQYVSALYASAGVTPRQGETYEAILAFGSGGGAGRAAALRRVAESDSLTRAEFNPAFVLMEYFGYLRRDPDEAGYQSWLNKLEQFGGDYRRAEMVKAFLESTEYQRRFGQP